MDLPDPRSAVRYVAVPFEEHPQPKPTEPAQIAYSLLDRLLVARRKGVDQRNRSAAVQYEKESHNWRVQVSELIHRKAAYDARQAHVSSLFSGDGDREVTVLEERLKVRLAAVSWPRETNVSFDVTENGRQVLLEVDLPEIEEMPRQTFVVARRELRLTSKSASERRVRELYMRHVHAVGLLILG